ncbi:SRPBCC family protein [Streptomyces sp. NPDC127190]|uniref:SRPBCC family protein n=1 Tax=unclassified Streptomyces TaxID=2593676 RepID=UPI003628F8F0
MIDVIRIEVTQPVNDPAEEGQYRLDRDELWDGLRRKAENAVPFIEGMSECTVLERRADGLVREVVVRGERIREDVVFRPGRRVSFHRDDDRATWVIHNEIGQDADGGLTLSFASEITFHGEDAAAGPDAATIERMRDSTARTVRHTLDVIRRTTGAA